MNKSELVKKISDKSGLTQKEADKALKATIETITETLSQDESITFVGFGTFLVRTRAERHVVNPRTREPMTIAPCKVPAFKAGKLLKEKIK